MGTDFHLVVIDASPLLIDRLEGHLHQLEARWSRFRETSEISALNREPDRFQIVGHETITLISRGIQAWRLTGGASDPTVLDALVAAGYDRSFTELGPRRHVGAPQRSPGCDHIEVDPELRMVRLGAGVRFDPGGIGKGLAADLLVEIALEAGAAGALVNIGGDLVCRGVAPTDDGWMVDITEPCVTDGPVALVGLTSGAVATSTTEKRRWTTTDGARHHIIDPATGRSSTGPKLVSVIAAEGWYAEAVATQLMVSIDRSAVDVERAAALVIERDGTVTSVGAFDSFVVTTPIVAYQASA